MTRTLSTNRGGLQRGPALMLCAFLCATLGGCTPEPAVLGGAVSPTIPAGTALAAELQSDRGTPPEGGADVCWGQETTPAVIETVTEQTELTPERRADDGSLLAAATYRSTSQQRIVSDRRAVWFRVPCPDVQDAAFIASLQRALKVRGLYRGPITAMRDPATSAAIRRYQAPQGLDSSTLSLAAARQLGLVPYRLEDL